MFKVPLSNQITDDLGSRKIHAVEPLHSDALASVWKTEGIVTFVMLKIATFGVVLSQVSQFVVPAQLLHRAGRSKMSHGSASQTVSFGVVEVQYQVHILGSHFDQHRPVATFSKSVARIAGYVMGPRGT